MEPKNITILFDLDGTVIDSTEAILESFDVTFRTHNFPHPGAAAVTSLIGHPLDSMFRQLKVKPEEVGEYVTTYKTYYRTVSKPKTRLLPKADEAVRRAAGFANLGVVTTKTGRYSKDLLVHLGVAEHFRTVVGFEDVANPKPHPEPVLKALHNMGSKSERIWMVGDTGLDILAAKAAGVEAVAVASGYESRESLEQYGVFVADNVLEAVEYIRSA